MKLFLDDFRQPKDCVSYMQKRIGFTNVIYLGDWTIVRNYDQFVDAVTKNIDLISHVSFDHDLADEHMKYYFENGGHKNPPDPQKADFIEKTGFDCAKWLKEYYEKNQKKLPTMFVHSMNPVGTKNIIDVFK